MKVYSTDGKEKSNTTLPSQFSEPIRDDLIRRAYYCARSNRRQPYGSDPRAGLKVSADLSRRRRHYKGSYGIGISRVPRKIMSHRGTQFNWLAAEAPGTVKGRRAHPPKAEKSWKKSINRKERRKAIRSALSATLNKEMVNKYHSAPELYPFALADDFETVSNTQALIKALVILGLEKELDRCNIRKVRAGVGKLRGRKYKTKTGPLIVVKDGRSALAKAGSNIPGVEVVSAKNLNAEVLANGGHPGRLTLFTEGALHSMEEAKLYQ